MIFEKIISSTANPVFRELSDLLVSKGIKKHARYLLFGEAVVREALAAARSGTAKPGMHKIAALVALENAVIGDYASDLPPGGQILRLTKPLFEELDVFGTRSPILACEAPVIPEWTMAAPQGREILLALSDPSNLGASLRSIAAFGSTKIVLLRECASPFHPRATRAASGLTLATPLERGPSIKDLAERLASRRGDEGAASVLSLDMSGESISEIEWPGSARLLLGEEGQGIPDGLLGRRVAIPMASGAESLNAACALSVAIYAWRTSARIKKPRA